MTADLVAFLRNRLDDDERIARAATDGNWVVDRPILADGVTTDISAEDTTRGYSSVATDSEGFGACSLADATHIARHDPARVLADVQAKRAILAQYVADAAPAEHMRPLVTAVRQDRMEFVVHALAAVYVSHPDYRPEWRVSTAAGGEHQT